MLPKLITTFLFFTILLHAPCLSQEKIYFEPKSALAAKQSDLITYNNIVVFETNEESKFDKYSSIIPTKHFFVVWDYSAKKIFVFDKTGRFIKKFSSKLDFGRLTYNAAKDGLEMVTPNKMFRLTNKDNAQILEDYTNPKNRKYYRKYFVDLKDTLNFTVHKLKIDQLDILNPVAYTDGMYFVNQVTVDNNFTKKEDHELKIYRGDSLLKQYFKYNKHNDSRYIFDRVTVYIAAGARSDEKWITHPYDYTIYALKKDSLYKVYDMVLPLDRAVTADLFAKDFQSKTEKDNYLRQNRKLVKQFYISHLSNRYLGFTMETMQYETQQFVYDKTAKQFYSYEKISPDSATYFLPLIKNNAFTDGLLMYTRITAQEALKIFEEHKKENIKYPPLLEAYLKTATPESNPVLINYNYSN